jgi:uncharacterized protein YqcC (DUF446 family)
MPRSYEEVEILISKLEQSLRGALLWSSHFPPTEAFQSELPFALDVMPFEHWLQFIFIPKISEIIDNKSPLPQSLVLLPMAQQSLSVANNQSELINVIDVIRQIDLAFVVL